MAVLIREGVDSVFTHVPRFPRSAIHTDSLIIEVSNMSSTPAASAETVMSLRIKLTSPNIKPRVWRRILVPRDYTFKELSAAIDSAMGWDGYPYHLYEYSLKHPRTYKEIEFGAHCLRLPITKIRKRFKIADVFTDSKVEVILYDYDMGNTKTHVINWEKDVPALKGEKYPKCTGGERQSPPEEDPGSDYSYSDVEQDFHHSKVDMSRCRQVKMGMPKRKRITELTSETNVATAERNMISSEISEPSIATMQDLPNDSSSSAAKTRTIATQTSPAISQSVQTDRDVLDESFSDESSYTIEDERDDSSSCISIEDELDDSSSSSIQNHVTEETDQDVEDMY